MNIFLQLSWLHFLSDFILQSDKMAINKSSSLRWLSIHIAVYSAPFLYFGWRFAIANAIAHFATDFFSSRATSYLWKKEKRHWFFVVIGLDQALHLTALFLTVGLIK